MGGGGRRRPPRRPRPPKTLFVFFFFLLVSLSFLLENVSRFEIEESPVNPLLLVRSRRRTDPQSLPTFGRGKSGSPTFTANPADDELDTRRRQVSLCLRSISRFSCRRFSSVRTTRLREVVEPVCFSYTGVVASHRQPPSVPSRLSKALGHLFEESPSVIDSQVSVSRRIRGEIYLPRVAYPTNPTPTSSQSGIFQGPPSESVCSRRGGHATRTNNKNTIGPQAHLRLSPCASMIWPWTRVNFGLHGVHEPQAQYHVLSFASVQAHWYNFLVLFSSILIRGPLNKRVIT